MVSAPVGLRARAQIASFALERPADATMAAAALAKPGRVAMMGGGLDLIDRLKRGEALDRLVALANISELRAVSLHDTKLSIGAGVTHATLINAPLVAAHLPDLQDIWRQIANPRVRATGTIGGNLLARQRHYDAAPALLALDAECRVATSDGTMSRVPLTELLNCQGCLLMEIDVPLVPGRRLFADRSLHPLVSVYLATQPGGSMRLVVGCAFERPLAIDLPNADPGVFARALAALPVPVDDDLASAAYRQRIAGVLGRRVLARATAS